LARPSGEAFLHPTGYTLNGEISWDASDDPEDLGCIYIKDNAIEAVDFLISIRGRRGNTIPFQMKR
jgi:hypothetical protein